MAYPNVRPNNEWVVSAATLSIGSTPVPAVCVAPVKGHIVRTGMASNGALTGTTVASCIITPAGGSAGSDIGSGALSLAAGTAITAIDTGFNINSTNNYVNEGDTITFTPSGGTGSSIGGNFFAVIREQG
jgi:hypothetical protein